MRKTAFILATLLVLSSLALAATDIDWDVVSSGGTEGNSGNVSLSGTLSQTAVGTGSSGSINASHGYWQEFPVGGPTYLCGDSDASGAVDIDDVVHLIYYIFAGGSPPDPIESGDADCSGSADIDDVVYLVSYIFGGGNTPCDPGGTGSPGC